MPSSGCGVGIALNTAVGSIGAPEGSVASGSVKIIVSLGYKRACAVIEARTAICVMVARSSVVDRLKIVEKNAMTTRITVPSVMIKVKNRRNVDNMQMTDDEVY